MNVKCFYCNSETNNDSSKNCESCSKELLKVCEKCGIKFEKSANFCMSCGGKLTDIEFEEDVFILEEVDEDNSDQSENPEEAEMLEIEVLEDLNEDGGEELLILEENDNKEPVLSTEKKSTKVDKEDHQIEKGGYFGTAGQEKTDGEPKVEERKKKKPGKKKLDPQKENSASNGSELDVLFDELGKVEKPDAEGGGGEFETPAKVNFEDIDDDPIVEDLKIENINISGVKKPDPKKYLKPVKIEDTYEISFDELSKTVITSEFEESCKPLLGKVQSNLVKGSGGIFFLRGDAGNGTGILVNRLKNFADEKNSSQSYNIAVSDANGFDFDFMIFIDLIRKLMKIKSSDVNVVRKKFDKLFGETLPKNKKECLSALICLNFIPLKTKLPKHDIEYLLAYVFYGLSRGKPVVWFVNNANVLNVRSIRFLDSLKKVFESMPMAVVMVVDPEASVLDIAEKDNVFDFKGFPEDKLKLEVAKSLNAKTIPAELEKLLKEKAKGNMLFTLQLAEYLKDKGFIFEMKGSWRFSKLPDDFKCPESLDELLAQRTELLPGVVAKVLKELALLNLFEVPKVLVDLVCGEQKEIVDDLVKKGYLLEAESSYRFASRTMLTSLRKNIKIGRAERSFYRDVVTKLSSTTAEIYQLNKHWLLLSYINLGGIVDKRLNSFLFSSAVYMEKLGFFEISQRSYQTIISSFESDNPFDDFKILPELKSARLWRFVDPQWGKLFWEKLENYALRKNNYHLELLAKSELLLLEREKIDFSAVAELLKKMHLSGLYEDEISLIDKTTDILIDTENYIDANTFAVRAYKILRDVVTRYDGKGVPPADFIYVLFVRCSCKLSEVCIMLGDLDKASAILEEALEYAERYEMSYFKSKVQFFLGKIKFESKDPSWKDYMKDGFYNAIIGMDFAIIKSFLYFFESNDLEKEEWVSPFLEYKNWINF